MGTVDVGCRDGNDRSDVGCEFDKKDVAGCCVDNTDLASGCEDAGIGVTDCPIDGNDDPEVGRSNTVLELVLVGVV